MIRELPVSGTTKELKPKKKPILPFSSKVGGGRPRGWRYPWAVTPLTYVTPRWSSPLLQHGMVMEFMFRTDLCEQGVGMLLVTQSNHQKPRKQFLCPKLGWREVALLICLRHVTGVEGGPRE